MLKCRKQSEIYSIIRMKSALAIAVCAAVLIVGGCGSRGSNGESYGSNNSGRYGTYSWDGALGYTNTNPNLLNRMQSTNYASDRDFVTELLKPFADIEDIKMSFNGTELNVDLRVKQTLTDQQLRKLRADAQSKLQFNMPRYEVHVKVKRS